MLLSKLSVKNKIITIIIISFAALFYFEWVYLHQALSDLSIFSTTEKNVYFLEKVSKTMHQLQLERGRSAVFLAGGINQAQLDSQRNNTNDIIDDLGKNISSSGFSKERQDFLFSLIGRLPVIRQKVIAHDNPNAIFDQYTKMIGDCFQVYQWVFNGKTTQGIGKYLKDLSVLETAKEYAGQTRALASSSIQRNAPLKDQEFLKLFSLQNNIEAYLTLEAVPFSEKTAKLVKKALDSNHWKQAKNALLIVAKRFQLGSYGLSSNNYFNSITNFINELSLAVDSENEFVRNFVVKLRSQTIRQVTLSIVLSIFFTLLVIITGVSVTQSVKNRIGETLDILKEISQGEGDLSRRLETNSHDEFGQMALFFNQFLDTLSRMIARVIQNNHQVFDVTSRVYNGNNELARRVDAQAASLEQTAASIEEMTANIKNIAENAYAAKTNTFDTQESALEGEEVLKEAVEAIQSITVQTSRIKEIIGIIDNIAFQTNILALNAAVEAARAKEHGKGFAVVANEVRNLAQKSAENAKQITDMIEEMIKGIERGNRLAQNSQEKFLGIKERIETTTEVIDEVAAASDEQSKGVDQINLAVSQLDEITQNNASMVQELTQSTQELEGQAQEVVELLRKFKINGEGSFDLDNSFDPFDNKENVLFFWEDKYSVGVQKMDSDHHKLFSIMNALYDALKEGANLEYVIRTLKELKDYTHYHFKAEEKLMKQYRYSGLAEQKNQHRFFEKKIQSATKEIKSKQSLTAVSDVLIFLKDWLVKHIMVIDKKYSDFFYKKGVK